MRYNDSGAGNAGPLEPPGQAAPHRMKRMGERAEGMRFVDGSTKPEEQGAAGARAE